MSAPSNLLALPVEVNQDDSFNQYVYNRSQIERAKHDGKVWKLKIVDNQVVEKKGLEYFGALLGDLFSTRFSKEKVYRNISESVNKIRSNEALTRKIQVNGKDYEPSPQEMKVAKISKDEMARHLSDEQLLDIINDRDWQALDPLEAEDIESQIGRITSEAIPKLKKDHPQFYVTAAVVGHRYRDQIQKDGAKELVIGKEIVLANTEKSMLLRKRLYEENPELGNEMDVQNNLFDRRKFFEVNPKLIAEAVKLARENFPEYFVNIKEDLSNLPANSYQFRLISDILVAQAHNPAQIDKKSIDSLMPYIDAFLVKNPHALAKDVLDNELKNLFSQFPRELMKRAITQYIIEGQQMPLSSYINVYGMKTEAILERQELQERLHNNILFHKADVISDELLVKYRELPRTGETKLAYVKESAELAKSAYPEYFNDIKDDFSNVEENPIALQILSRIATGNRESMYIRPTPEFIEAYIHSEIDRHIDQKLTRAELNQLINEKIDSDPKIEKKYKSDIKNLITKYLDINFNSDSNCIQEFEKRIGHGGKVNNEFLKAHSLVESKEKNLLETRLVQDLVPNEANIQEVALKLHTEKIANSGFPTSPTPSVETFKTAVNLYKNYFPLLYGKIEKSDSPESLAAAKKQALDVIKILLWGDKILEGALKDNTVSISFPDEKLTGYHLSLIDEATLEELVEAELSQDLNNALLLFKDEQLGSFKINFAEVSEENPAFQVGHVRHSVYFVGEFPDTLAPTMDVDHQLYASRDVRKLNNQEALKARMRVNLNDLNEHYIQNIARFPLVSKRYLTPEEFKRILAESNTQALNFDWDNFTYNGFLTLSEDEKYLIKQAAEKNGIQEQVAIDNAVFLRQYYLLSYINELQKQALRLGAIQRFTL